MLLIPCPWCGPRAQIEFSYGGDASVARPEPPAKSASAPAMQSPSAPEPRLAADASRQWLDHIYLRDNVRGPHLEWWQHSSGCRAWIKVRRDTATHQILGAWRATETLAPAPDADTGGAGSRQ